MEEYHMKTQENSTGRPLADFNWLEDHHIAKLPERTAFAKKLSALKPNSIVDLGCATGLWLELLNDYLPDECSFVGIDSDLESLNLAKKRSERWKRKAEFLHLDIEKDVRLIPSCDLTLAFNIFSYISDLDIFLYLLSKRQPHGYLAVRQYDGASVRFGPMSTSDRQQMELDLRLSTENSQKFHHYDLDRTFNALHNALINTDYNNGEFGFELFKRTSPFPESFIKYYMNTLEWTRQHISVSSAEKLKRWIDMDPDFKLQRYFYEVDLVAILS